MHLVGWVATNGVNEAAGLEKRLTALDLLALIRSFQLGTIFLLINYIVDKLNNIDLSYFFYSSNRNKRG